MKKYITLLLVLMLAVCLFSGCLNINNNKPTEPSGPAKLTVWIKENLRVEDYETNEMTKWLEEKANVDLTFVRIPSSDYASKVNLALTSGKIEDLPDVIIANNVNASQLQTWGEAGSIISLSKYFENDALTTNFREAEARVGGRNLLENLTSANGEVYGFPVFNQSFPNEYPHKIWMYKPWLDKLQVTELPKTTEEFYQLLKRVKATDLNGNGKPDEIGMMGNNGTYAGYFAVLMNAFVYAGQSDFLTLENDTVGAAYTTNEWKQGLAYIEKLFNEGLIPKEALTYDNQQFETLLTSAEPQIFCYAYYTPNDKNWVSVEPLTGPNGVKYATYRPTLASNSPFYITANCKDPEAAFRLGDWMCSEYIGISQRFGKQGVDWDYAKDVPNAEEMYRPSVTGYPLTIICYDDANFWSGDSTTNNSWRQNGIYIRQYEIVNGMGLPIGTPDEYTELTNAASAAYQNGKWHPEQVLNTPIFDSEEMDIIADAKTNISNAVSAYWAAVCSGDKDLETTWDAYIDELEQYNLDEYLYTVQEAYNRTK